MKTRMAAQWPSTLATIAHKLPLGRQAREWRDSALGCGFAAFRTRCHKVSLSRTPARVVRWEHGHAHRTRRRARAGTHERGPRGARAAGRGAGRRLLRHAVRARLRRRAPAGRRGRRPARRQDRRRPLQPALPERRRGRLRRRPRWARASRSTTRTPSRPAAAARASRRRAATRSPPAPAAAAPAPPDAASSTSRWGAVASRARRSTVGAWTSPMWCGASGASTRRWSSACLDVAQPLARDQQVEVVVARRARSIRAGARSARRAGSRR